MDRITATFFLRSGMARTLADGQIKKTVRHLTRLRITSINTLIIRITAIPVSTVALFTRTIITMTRRNLTTIPRIMEVTVSTAARVTAVMPAGSMAAARPTAADLMAADIIDRLESCSPPTP